MPIIKSKSKAALSHNIEAEMQSGKPQKQSIAIAMDMQRRNKRKKMASGGPVAESASNERRPMPDQRAADTAMASRNSAQKAPSQDQWSDQPTVAQARKPALTRLSRPKMVGSDAFSVRDRDEVESDLHRVSSEAPDGIGRQPSHMLDEDGADRQGPSVEALKMKRMADGGSVMEDHDEAHMQSALAPSEDEGSADARHRDEMAAKRSGPSVPDMARQHSDAMRPYAEGGEVADDSNDIDIDEVEDGRHSSIAAAIMAKRQRFADGGQVDLSMNADEEPNNEDQMSFEALKKENYSESEGLDDLGDQPHDSNLTGDSREMDEENEHDHISRMRSKMRSRRQMP